MSRPAHSGSFQVVHIVPAAPFGGAQRLAIDLAARQAAKGTAARILFLSRNSGDRDPAAVAAKSSGVRADIVSGSALAQVRSLHSALRRELPDLVHLHMPSPPMLAVLAPPRRFALVVHLHARPILSVHAPTLVLRVTALAQRILLARSNRAIAISQWIAEAWRKVQPRLDPVIVYNGVALPTNIPPKVTAGAFTVGMASRLSERKGVEEFLIAAAAIHSKAPDIRFRIAGDGPQRGTYERRAADLGVEDAVNFEGFISDMSAFWSALDLAAFNSPFEPFGLRLTEPVAAGTPVVAYRTGTGADEVIDRCRGVAAVPYGDISAFVDTVIALRGDAAARTRMTQDGRADIAAQFEIGVMEAGVSKVYCNAISSHKAQG